MLVVDQGKDLKASERLSAAILHDRPNLSELTPERYLSELP